MPERVIEQPYLRLAGSSVTAQSTFGKEGLREAALDGHLDEALEHTPIEFVAGTTPHEERAHAPDQRPQRPNDGPLPRRVAEGCTMFHHVSQ